MNLQRQWVQSLGQFLIVFVSGLAVYKGPSEIMKMGWGDALWQPFIQGVLSALLILGFAKVGPKAGGVAIVLALLLAGCATLPVNPADMTADQLKHLVKDKNANVGCATVQTPYKGNVVYMVLDKSVIVDGTLTVKSDCEITLTNSPKK